MLKEAPFTNVLQANIVIAKGNLLKTGINVKSLYDYDCFTANLNEKVINETLPKIVIFDIRDHP